MKQFEPPVNRTLLCQWLGLPRSVYYYQPQSSTPGAKPSQMTMKLDGSWVDNQQVIMSIRQLLNVEFNALGYEYITHELKKEYLIYKKKVYLLILEHNLLLGKMIHPTMGKPEFVKVKRIEATKPLEYL